MRETAADEEDIQFMAGLGEQGCCRPPMYETKGRAGMWR